MESIIPLRQHGSRTRVLYRMESRTAMLRSLLGGLWRPMRQHPRWAVGVLVALLALGAVLASRRFPWSGWGEAQADSAGSHWQQAQQALEAHDFAQAKTHIGRCLEVWPIDAEAHFLLARTCRRAEDMADWQRHLKNAEVLQWPRAALDLERLLMQAQVGDVGRAEPLLRGRLATPHADELLIYEALVKGHLAADRLNDVLYWTNFWLERHPTAWQPRLYRGRCFHLALSLHRAIAEYQRVLELKPDQVQVRLWLAGSLMLDGQYQEALAQFQAYVQGRPDDPTALLGIANCLVALNELEAAHAALDVLLARQHNHPGAFLLQAKLELAQGKAAEALSWLKRAEALAPHETDITHTFSLVLRQLGRHDEAGAYERQLQDLRQRYEQLEQLRKRIVKEPENASLRYEVGTRNLGLGREEEAVRWLRSVLQLDPNHQLSHQALAEYYRKHGEGKRAEYHQQRATESRGPG